MDYLRTDFSDFEDIKLSDIFDVDLIADPDHPKIVRGLFINEDDFQGRLAQRHELSAWAKWQNGLFVALVMIAAYSWHLVQFTSKPLFTGPQRKTQTISVALSMKENIVDSQVNESSIEQALPVEEAVVDKASIADNLSTINEIPKTTKLVENNGDSQVNDMAGTENSSLGGLSYRQSIETYVKDLNNNEVYSEKSVESGGTPLKEGVMVFDSKLKEKLEGSYVTDMNSKKRSGKTDVYTDVHGSDVSRIGNSCVTTIRNPGIGEWTYISSCTQPPDKLRRFGREVSKPSLGEGRLKP